MSHLSICSLVAATLLSVPAVSIAVGFKVDGDDISPQQTTVISSARVGAAVDALPTPSQCPIKYVVGRDDTIWELIGSYVDCAHSGLVGEARDDKIKNLYDQLVIAVPNADLNNPPSGASFSIIHDTVVARNSGLEQ